MNYLEPAFAKLPPPFDVDFNLLEENLKELSFETGPVLQQARKAMEITKAAFYSLRQAALNGFLSDESDEIRFFKKIKPSYYSLWKFWKEVYAIEWHRPAGEGSPAHQYLQRHLDQIEHLFEDHREFWSYYQNGETVFDEIYFLRKNRCKDAFSFCMACEQEDSFCTSRDGLVADLLAGRFLENYLKSEIRCLAAEMQLQVQQNLRMDSLKWTASKSAITELIYALNEYGAFGNSNRQLRTVSQYFCQVFSIEIPNIYKVYEENRKRKKCRTPFLDGLKISLTRKMELDDMNLSDHY